VKSRVSTLTTSPLQVSTEKAANKSSRKQRKEKKNRVKKVRGKEKSVMKAKN
jgi:hypothetical protein